MVNDEVIKNISYDQHEILYNIMQLHNNAEPFECDPTYSIGNFYGDFRLKNGNNIVIPKPIYKYDVAPQTEDTEKLEIMGRIPLDDNSISSIVIDLPFIISPHNAPSVVSDDGSKVRNVIFRRFSSFYPLSELLETYSHFLKEAYRVLKDKGICVFKTQNNISGGKFICTEEYSWVEAQKHGFHVLDRFILLAQTRIISGKVKKQEHARNYSSTFWVFKKEIRKKQLSYYSWHSTEINEDIK